jgi:hypothetical protein
MQTGEDLKFPNPVRSTGRFYRALKRIELDLSSITWAVLHLKIERPGRYEISAAGISGADPAIHLLRPGLTEAIDDNEHNSDANLLVSLDPGTYTVTVNVWWYARGPVRMLARGPI